MSYEGRYDGLCENGHKCGFSARYSMDEELNEFDAFRCKAQINGRDCGAKLGYLNSVDETNLDEYGFREYIELTPSITKTCNMNCTHVVTEATYKFSDEQKYWDGKSWIVYNKSKMQKYKSPLV